MKIILIGLPGVGKTTIGKKIAKRLDIPFKDTDQEIEKIYPKKATCREIFNQYGESYFRKLEKQAVLSSIKPSELVLATGGGTLLEKETASYLKNQGTLIYLRASPEWIYSRVQENGCPAYMYGGNSVKNWEELASKRTSIYEKYACLSFSADQLSQCELINQIIRSCDGQ